MGLPTGWITDGADLTQNQQITATSNGVLPLQVDFKQPERWSHSQCDALGRVTPLADAVNVYAAYCE